MCLPQKKPTEKMPSFSFPELPLSDLISGTIKLQSVSMYEDALRGIECSVQSMNFSGCDNCPCCWSQYAGQDISLIRTYLLEVDQYRVWSKKLVL